MKQSSFRVGGGDIVISVDIVPDPDEIEIQLMQVASNLENTVSPLVASARIASADMKQRFTTETDPDGNPWIPLDEEYLANKLSLGYPPNILHRTGDLEKAATGLSGAESDIESEEATLGPFRIMGDSLFFDVSDLPEYGIFHQAGSADQANVGIAARHRFAAANEEGYAKREGGGHSSTGVGTGNALPARPFIGMSEEAETEVWAVFDFWFEQSISSATVPYVHPTGTVQSRIAGRFGPKIIF